MNEELYAGPEANWDRIVTDEDGVTHATLVIDGCFGRVHQPTGPSGAPCKCGTYRMWNGEP